MQGLHAVILRISKVLDVVGGVVLSLMMLITVADVILRFFGKPITGTYELVFLAGAVVIGCAIPQTSWQGGHVNVDFVLEYLPRMVKDCNGSYATHGDNVLLFLGWNLLSMVLHFTIKMSFSHPACSVLPGSIHFGYLCIFGMFGAFVWVDKNSERGGT